MTAGKHISCAGEVQLLVYIQVKEVSYLPGLQMLNVFDIQFQCCIAPAQVKKKMAPCWLRLQTCGQNIIWGQ